MVKTSTKSAPEVAEEIPQAELAREVRPDGEQVPVIRTDDGINLPLAKVIETLQAISPTMWALALERTKSELLKAELLRIQELAGQNGGG